MKKQLMIFIFATMTISSWATVRLDTIPFWHIYYGKVLLVQGNIIQPQTEKHEIKIKKETPWELIVTFNYDIGPPDKGELTIRQGNKTLKIIEFKRGDEGRSRVPSTGGGSFFIVPLKDIIDTKAKNGRWELDFYYTDLRGQENLKLGTIIFVT